jgi:Ca-activated chloride channel family protein
MSFDHPLMLLALLVIPAAVGLYLLAERRRMRYAVRFTNLAVLAPVAASRRAWRRYVPPVVFLLALATLCVGLARPHVQSSAASDRATVILVVDASRSMSAQDVKPSRLGAAQAAVRTFLDRVPKRLRVGLVVFSGEAQVAAPPTTDRDLVRQAVDDIGEFRGFGGTAIGDAIAAAVELGQGAVGGSGGELASVTTAAKTNGLVSILFLSDGRQTRGELQPLEGAARAKAAGIRVYTVALGTPHGSVRGFGGGGGGFGPFNGRIRVAPDPATLKAIAEATGGQFFAARSAGALEAAYKKLGSSLGRTKSRTEVTYAFVGGAAALLLAAGLLSALWSARLP